MLTPGRPMPEVEPLVYFGNWCGPSWSAGHRTTKPLTASDLRHGGIFVYGSNGKYRQSPVDLACKAHDIAYDAADNSGDPLRRAEMILEADRQLLTRVARLFARQDAGALDLNMGEYLFARNVQIAFRTKLITDGAHVVEFEAERGAAVGVRVTAAVIVGPQMLFYGIPMGQSHPIVARVRGSPVRR